MKTVQDGQVVSMEYTLHVDGEIFDSSKDHGPLEFLQGAGNIIPGLEHELTGMAIGETKKVIVAPEDAYGEFAEEALVNIPRGEFPAEIPLEVGVELQVQNELGEPMSAVISAVQDDSVQLDFNHPLAGKELHFDVTIVDLREATDEEKAHGHVHDGGHNH
jgi:FKBP-type peptidyl-prolyl cis-trans isomerase SlyD